MTASSTADANLGAGGAPELVRVEGLEKHFPVTRGVLTRHVIGTVRAVDGVDFSIRRGETLGLVGESGCGKSTTGLLVAGLLAPSSGRVFFDGRDLFEPSTRGAATSAGGPPVASGEGGATGGGGRGGGEAGAGGARGARGDETGGGRGSEAGGGRAGTARGNRRGRRRRQLSREVQMIFQDPYSSLNPRHTVGTIVGAPFRYQQIEPPGGIKHAVQELLERVGLSAEHYNRYPSDFSGGQRQRICVARAVALGPRLIVADEPVSALDVSIQAQIVNLVSDLQAENDMACLFISHDLSVVRHVARRVAVMYLGRIVEIAEGDLLYANPLHPYTNALLSAAPVPDPVATARRRRIRLSGELPSALDPPSGCRFRTRCWKAEEICAAVDPPLAGDGRQRVACHFPESGATPPGS